MKAVLYDPMNAKWNLVSFPMPVLKDGEALVRVHYAGLCGSDMHRINRPSEDQARLPLGHEIVGEIKAKKTAANLDPGNFVVVNPIINCGACQNCRDGRSQFCQNIKGIGKNQAGGFSEYLAVPTTHLYKMKKSTEPKVGVLVDGTAVIINALSKATKIPNNVLIVGDGTVAALTAAVMRAKFPDVKIEISGKNPKNIDFICDQYHVFPADINQSNYDLAIETVGRSQSETLNLCVNSAKVGGTVLVLGVYPENFSIAFNGRSAFYKEVNIIGINSFVKTEERDDFKDALDLIEESPELFLNLVTHVLPLGQFNQGVNLMMNKKESGAIKIAYMP